MACASVKLVDGDVWTLSMLAAQGGPFLDNDEGYLYIVHGILKGRQHNVGTYTQVMTYTLTNCEVGGLDNLYDGVSEFLV